LDDLARLVQKILVYFDEMPPKFGWIESLHAIAAIALPVEGHPVEIDYSEA
jgi:hypothetical protein